MKIIVNKQISEQIYDIPKILPNNLNLIKTNYGISTSEIAHALGLNRNFIGNVANEKANFSGLSVIKFIHHFNIPFNLIFRVNKEVTFYQTIHSCNICIFQGDKNYSIDNEEELNRDIIKLSISDFLQEENDNFIKFIKKIENNSIIYTYKDREEHYEDNLIKYQKLIKSVTYDYDNYNYFCMVYEVDRKDVPITKHINLQKNIDVDLIRYLESKDFISYKYRLVNIPYKQLLYNEDDKSYKLPQTYSFLINNELVESDTIKKCDTVVNKNIVSFTTVSKTSTEITKLKYVAEYNHYSKKDMADKLNLSEETYKAIERGYQKISAQTMLKIELEFGVLLASVLNIEEYYKKYCID